MLSCAIHQTAKTTHETSNTKHKSIAFQILIPYFGLMVRWFLFVLIGSSCYSLNAHLLPHWETSAYVYTKTNSGYDFHNVLGAIFEKPNGKIICQPYQKNFFEIGNTSIHELRAFSKYSKFGLAVFFCWNKLDWYCTSEGFYATKNGKIIREFKSFLKPTESMGGFHLFQNQLYFITYGPNHENKIKHKLYSFDGKHIQMLKKNLDGALLKSAKQKLYTLIQKNGQLFIYAIENKGKLNHKNSLWFNGYLDHCISFHSPKQFQFWDHSGFIHTFKNKNVTTRKAIKYYDFMRFNDNHRIENWPLYRSIRGRNNQSIAQTSLASNIGGALYTNYSNSFYVGTETNFLRMFPHIKMYPRIFFNNNSHSTFSLTQDHKGRIWAGSYQGVLSVFDQKGIIHSKSLPYKWLSQGFPLKNRMLLPTETENGVLSFETSSSFRKIADSVSVFSIFKAKNDVLYLGTALKGLWYASVSDLDKRNIQWQKITPKNGLNQKNIIAVGEDQFGNIWTGNGGSIAVYQPTTNKCTTWEKDDIKDQHVGARSILLDSKKTLWFGCVNGTLYYLNGSNKPDINQLKQIKHPLLQFNEPITFLHEWKNHLIIGAKDHVLIFDLGAWYSKKEIKVQYLNPIELNLKGTTEQNTCFTDKTDHSFWFSTSENIYQIDLEKWLTIPKAMVSPSIELKTDSLNTYLRKQNKSLIIPAGKNTFTLSVNYQSKDNLPRLISCFLSKSNESFEFPQPGLNHHFNFSNLEAGNYVFNVRICQQNGTSTTHHYPIKIEAYLWQLWWFWASISLIPIALLTYIFIKRTQYKEKERQIAHLNLATLSNQFRPHFMLNALNGVAAQLDGKPKAEMIINHLGESVDLLFQAAKSSAFTHSFSNEWRLTQNMIALQKLLYLPDLTVSLSGIEQIPSGFKLPTGLIQIPVENALLHGLRHKTTGERLLEIQVSKTDTSYIISIKDNGIGRKAAEKINSFKKNGSGLETIHQMIKLLNQLENRKLSFTISDNKPEGTIVTIQVSQ